MFKANLAEIEANVEQAERDYRKGLITYIEKLDWLVRSERERQQILADAFGAGELVWKVEPPKESLDTVASAEEDKALNELRRAHGVK